MLTLYRKQTCSACDELEGQLRELRLAHKVVCLDDSAASTGGFPSDIEPPILQDGGETYAGRQAIGRHVEQVAQLKDRWQKHGADACYCEEDGEVL